MVLSLLNAAFVIFSAFADNLFLLINAAMNFPPSAPLKWPVRTQQDDHGDGVGSGGGGGGGRIWPHHSSLPQGLAEK